MKRAAKRGAVRRIGGNVFLRESRVETVLRAKKKSKKWTTKKWTLRKPKKKQLDRPNIRDNRVYGRNYDNHYGIE